MNNLLRKAPYFYSSDGIIGLDKIGELIQRHQFFTLRYKLLMDYYKGEHDILSRVMDDNKPNTRLIHSFPEYITNVKTGYFAGSPVSYTSSKQSNALDVFSSILENNDEQTVNFELSRMSSIYGHAYELLWLDSDNQIRFKELSPENTIMVYDSSIDGNTVACIRYFKYTDIKNVDNYEVYLYTDTHIHNLQGKSIDKLDVISSTPHIFGRVPVIEYVNNAEKLGDFENVIELINAYELIASDATNEIQYFNDAYLVIKNLLGTDDNDIKDMKNNRVISLDSDGEASWLVKNINDKHVQNTLDRLQNDIHKFSKTPDLTAESFVSNLSGVALKYRLWSLEQDAKIKERTFKQSLLKRLQLISNALNVLFGENISIYDLKIVFTRNIPLNLNDTADQVSKLNGIVSTKTLLSLMPFIDDVNEELTRIEQQQENALIYAKDFITNPNNNVVE